MVEEGIFLEGDESRPLGTVSGVTESLKYNGQTYVFHEYDRENVVHLTILDDAENQLTQTAYDEDTLDVVEWPNDGDKVSSNDLGILE